jgi:hypothetical protein
MEIDLMLRTIGIESKYDGNNFDLLKKSVVSLYYLENILDPEKDLQDLKIIYRNCTFIIERIHKKLQTLNKSSYSDIFDKLNG